MAQAQPTTTALRLFAGAVALALALHAAVTSAAERACAREEPFRARALRLAAVGHWLGDGVAYGPHRDGQRPGGPGPSRAQLREDLRVLARRWGWVRLYGASDPAATVLDVIRRDRLGLRVMLGAWIEPEERRDSTGRGLEVVPGAHAANRREIDAAVRLAGAYPDVVAAVCVGSETQVAWSSHHVPLEQLVRAVREARARVPCPVASADDYQWWLGPESDALARELDCVVVHAHPLWNGVALDSALAWTARVYADVRAAHPGQDVVLGETGWATARRGEGEQARLMKAEASEAAQGRYFAAYRAWVRRGRVPAFWFEAFDERWKGGDSPDDAEKHWGLYRADRTPKAAVAGGE